MSWNEKLGSGLTNEHQDNPACISAARFFGDCLRTKSSEVQAVAGTYTEDKLINIMDDAWNENALTEEQILNFEAALYSRLFQLFYGNEACGRPEVYVDFDPPQIIQDAANVAGFSLERGDLPVETKVWINGLTTTVTKKYREGDQVFVYPVQCEL